MWVVMRRHTARAQAGGALYKPSRTLQTLQSHDRPHTSPVKDRAFDLDDGERSSSRAAV